MYIIMGLPGAGKTTVLNGLKQEMPELKIMNYGDLMMEIMKEKYGIESRDEMRKKLSIDDQKKVQEMITEKLSAFKDRNCVLDTHCAVKTPKGYLPGLPMKTLSRITVDGLMLITANPEEIYERRKNDPSRARDHETLEDLRMHDDMSKYMLATYAVYTGAPAMIIYNKAGKVADAVAKIVSIMKGL
jgi:adenylate kinase